MTTQFAMDLRLARRKSGLSQEDVAHLLGVRQATISQLESGKFHPSLKQVVDLALVYDRSFESYFSQLTKERQTVVWQRLAKLSDQMANNYLSVKRHRSLSRLSIRLKRAYNRFKDE